MDSKEFKITVKSVISSFRLFDLCHRNFVHFQGRPWRRTGRTPTKDNVENGQNYMAEAFGPLYTKGSKVEFNFSNENK